VITVVIPNWNGGARLTRVLKDLGAQTQRPKRVIVVDNGSTDESDGAAEDAGAEVIRLGTNRGFAPAVNEGIRRAETPLVAILNNDLELVPDWLEQMADGLSRYKEARFATGKIFSAQRRDRLDGTFDLISLGLSAWRAGHGCPDGPLWNRERYIASTSLTAAVFQRGVFDTVGLLDEQFESYLEDVDLSIRCSIHGFVGVYLPRAVSFHVGSATLGAWSPRMVELIARNHGALVTKYGGSRKTLVAQLLWGLLSLRHGAFFAWFQGYRQSAGAEPVKLGENERAQLRAALGRQELELGALQKATLSDTYWKLYFLLS
jgi:GT2 family glycosyltransferase